MNKRVLVLTLINTTILVFFLLTSVNENTAGFWVSSPPISNKLDDVSNGQMDRDSPIDNRLLLLEEKLDDLLVITSKHIEKYDQDIVSSADNVSGRGTEKVDESEDLDLQASQEAYNLNRANDLADQIISVGHMSSEQGNQLNNWISKLDSPEHALEIRKKINVAINNNLLIIDQDAFF